MEVGDLMESVWQGIKFVFKYLVRCLAGIMWFVLSCLSPFRTALGYLIAGFGLLMGFMVGVVFLFVLFGLTEGGTTVWIALIVGGVLSAVCKIVGGVFAVGIETLQDTLYDIFRGW